MPLRAVRFIAAAVIALGHGSVFAQQFEPRIGYVYPAGGQQGTTFTAVIGGQHLNNATSVLISPGNVTATVVGQEKQLTPKEQQEAKEMLSKIQEKRKNGEPLSSDEMKSAMEIRKKLTAFGRKFSNPALSEFVTLQFSVPPNALAGKYEVRLLAQSGLSNPMSFFVGELPEFSKPDWKSLPRSRKSMDPAIPKTEEIKVALPTVLNGQIPPGGVDKYRFSAKAGQSLLVSVSARELIPYLADAVPGWFQAVVTLYDGEGKEVAYSDDFRFRPDPILFYKIPKDGSYVLEIKDSLFRGREDFVYRITVGELPFVTGVFPLGGMAGTISKLAANGWNLPGMSFTLDMRGKQPGVYPLILFKLSNPVLVAVDSLPEIFETEPNNSPASAQSVTLPVTINGHVDKPGDWDVFRFEGKAGEQIVAEVTARRLDSPLDSVIKLTDASGNQLAYNDDHEDKGSGLNTHHADSYFIATLPVAGPYFVHVGDAQHDGGPSFSYRLRLSAPRPDFELRVAPSAVNVRAGASAPLTIYALRRDGFDGEIDLALMNPPPGLTLTAAKIPAGQDQIKCTLSAAPEAAKGPATLAMVGRARVKNREVVRAAVPADDMMQAFSFRHLVAAESLQANVGGRFQPFTAAKILSKTPLRLPAGASITLLVSMPAGQMTDKVQYELNPVPEGISIQSMTPTSIVLQTDRSIVKPGQKGNLIFLASTERAMTGTDGANKSKASPRRFSIGALPAVPYEIISE